MALITKADLERRATISEVARFAGPAGSADAKIADMIAKAENRMRSEAIKWCTPASWDAMTSATSPSVAAVHLISDALEMLSFGYTRSDEYVKKSEEARLFRIRLAKNEERCFDGVLVPAGGSDGADTVRVAAPSSRSMDYTSTSSPVYFRDPPL